MIKTKKGLRRRGAPLVAAIGRYERERRAQGR